MDWQMFLEVVRQMRQAQNDYFTHRRSATYDASQDMLRRSCALEGAVDKMIRDHDSKQTKLFDTETQ